MEVKKSPKADLKNKRGLLLEIGLIVSLCAVIVAFMYTPAEKRVEQVDMNYAPVEAEITEITRQDQKPPEAPKKVEISVISDILQVVTNNTKVETNYDFSEFNEDVEIIQQVAVQEEVIEEEEIFIVAETMPTFQGGDIRSFNKWVGENIKYPAMAMENNLKGRVLVSFVVEKDGRISNIKVLQSPDKLLSDEAVRVVKSSPKWKPAMQRNRPVRLTFTMPVDFRLSN